MLSTDAASANLRELRRSSVIATRMLLLGLPMTLLLGFGLAFLLFDQFSWLEAAILATILAPTDAALGRSVVKHAKVSPRIRQSLNAQSGLNDGICVPVLLLFLALAGRGCDHHSGGWQLALLLFAEEIVQTLSNRLKTAVSVAQ